MIATILTALHQDAVALGILIVVLGLIFYTSNLNNKYWKRFYTFFPPLLLCYFVPALLKWPLNVISSEGSQLYYVASRYMLPASLIFLCLGTDLKGIIGLGGKSIIMFLTATIGVVIGGPIALLITQSLIPTIADMDSDSLWRGLATVGGSWIGGGANQAAMKEIFEVPEDVFGGMIVVDVICSNLWLGILLFSAKYSDRIDNWLGADNSAIKTLESKISSFRAKNEKNPSTNDLMYLMAIGFGGVALATLGANLIQPFMESYKDQLDALKMNALTSHFFWLVVLATAIGLAFSFTKVKKMEGIGASKFGSLFIYFLVATIGMKMNINEVFNNPIILTIGFVWITVHVLLLLTVAKLIKAPLFFVAVGSQANIGGAASAPVVASAFNPSLAPVGALMAVLGYTLGTYGALICAYLMQLIAS